MKLKLYGIDLVDKNIVSQGTLQEMHKHGRSSYPALPSDPLPSHSIPDGISFKIMSGHGMCSDEPPGGRNQSTEHFRLQ